MNMEDALMELEGNALRRSSLSLVDAAGTVFFWGDRLLRAVREEAVAGVRALLTSGLPDALAERGWAPRCWETELRIPGYALVLEQARLPVVSYPYEWSYSMLRDAAVRVLEVNTLAREFGWELKDCHGFNVVFDGAQPMWVDLGSFGPCASSERGWPAWEEFVRFYEYPLRIWSHGGGFIALRLVAVGQLMNHVDHGLYRWPFLRWGGAGVYDRWVRRWYHLHRLTRTPDEKFKARLGPVMGRLACSLKAWGWLPGSISIERAKARTLSRRRRGPSGTWSNYQASGPESVGTPRFDRIVELLRRFEADSVVELAGNRGWLSERLLREKVVKSAICTDADEQAIDCAHERARSTGGGLHTAVVNFVVPMINPNGGDWPEERLRADAVLALAVTHHLLLTQQMPVERVLANIAGYARKIAFVEFMPLGLSDGRTAPPVPAWYTLDWFREAFGQRFKILHEEMLEPNRHLFCGAPFDADERHRDSQRRLAGS